MSWYNIDNKIKMNWLFHHSVFWSQFIFILLFN